MTAAEPVVDVRDVSKRFVIPSVRRETVREYALDFFRRRPQERLTVLDGVSFAVRRGESVGIMGRNGCGKSTLLKIIAGIYQPDAGRVEVRAGLTPILELGVGFNPALTAVDNIYLLGTVMGLTLKQVRRSLDEILHFAELERFAQLRVQHFSSGMVARLAYAVAFHAVHDVLILDEVFAVGDAAFQARCLDRYRALSRAGHTILLVSHDPAIIAQLCSRAILLDAGRVLRADASDLVAAEYVRLLSGSAAASGAAAPV